jgi:hypothetical protein
VGNKLFGTNISKLIKDNIGPGVLDATLTVVTPGSRTPGSLTGGTNPTTTDHSCKGFIDSKEKKRFPETLVEDGSEVIVLIGDTIGAVPKVGDRITIESKTYTIKELDRDPAAAVYTCLCTER